MFHTYIHIQPIAVSHRHASRFDNFDRTAVNHYQSTLYSCKWTVCIVYSTWLGLACVNNFTQFSMNENIIFIVRYTLDTVIQAMYHIVNCLSNKNVCMNEIKLYNWGINSRTVCTSNQWISIPNGIGNEQISKIVIQKIAATAIASMAMFTLCMQSCDHGILSGVRGDRIATFYAAYRQFFILFSPIYMGLNENLATFFKYIENFKNGHPFPHMKQAQYKVPFFVWKQKEKSEW